MLIHVWLLPFALLAASTLIAFPLSRYAAWIMDGKYRPPPFFGWFEKKLNSGQMNWKQYGGSLLLFNTILFVYGYCVLALTTPLFPSTIFHSVASFMTNTDLQHYAGETLPNVTQILFCIANFFMSAAIGLSALTAIIRALRGDPSVGNFFVDMWRIIVYLFLPLAFIIALFFIQQGSPMTFQASFQASTLEGGVQTIAVGPVAPFESIKLLGTNGGGFYAMNSAHPFENPTALSNFFNTLSMMLFPFSLVLMFGRMLGSRGHSFIIFSVMLLLTIATVVWSISFDTLKPNPGLKGLPIDQHLGNLEGKELRFGTSAGATFAALTADVTCGAVNAEADSLNPLAALAPMVGMWLNCLFGGKGVGMINMLLYIIIGIFIAGMMVGRTPEYLGKKIGPREVKLAIIALLVHPMMILLPTGLFAATPWGLNATSNPGPHGFSQMVYQYSSASANNGSAFDGLKVDYPDPEAIAWDLGTGLVMIFSRFLPILAPLAMAAYLGAKKPAPVGLGTLRVDTATFGCLFLGTIVVIGALLFLPVAALGPIAEHYGPIPFERHTDLK